MNFKLFGKTIFVVNLEFGDFFWPSTQPVNSASPHFSFPPTEAALGRNLISEEGLRRVHGAVLGSSLAKLCALHAQDGATELLVAGVAGGPFEQAAAKGHFYYLFYFYFCFLWLFSWFLLFIIPESIAKGSSVRSPWTSYAEPSCTDWTSYAEPSCTEPSYIEPSCIEPSYIEPSCIEPSYEEPSYIEPSYIEPSYIEPSFIEPSYIEPSYIEPSYIEPSYIEPSYIEPSYIEPSYIEPGGTEPRLGRACVELRR